MRERIQKYLSRAGICSRRKAEEYIQSGAVRVGRKTAKIGDTIDPLKDEVFFNGSLVEITERPVYYLLYKPRGYVSTTSDPEGRKTVIDLLRGVKQRVYPVGRLDYDTEGLLILTNDGYLTNGLTHPKHHIPKTYKVRCYGALEDSSLEKLATGVVIDGYKTKPSKVTLIEIDDETSLVEMVIKEGKNRQIRKMFDEIGHPVKKLTRTQIDFITIGKLNRGSYRELNKSEVLRLKNYIKKNL